MHAQTRILQNQAVRQYNPDSAAASDATTARLRAFIHAAVDDLRGSVSADVLPEMAARLAHHRMAAADERTAVR